MKASDSPGEAVTSTCVLHQETQPTSMWVSGQLYFLTARFLHRGDLMLPGIPWMPRSESRRCLCQLQWDWWKVALEAEIPANWQRCCGLAPLFPPHTGVVCLYGWYTAPGINELLVSTAIRPPGESAALRLPLAFVHLLRKTEAWPCRGGPSGGVLVVTCGFNHTECSKYWSWRSAEFIILI